MNEITAEINHFHTVKDLFLGKKKERRTYREGNNKNCYKHNYT